ncbi:hypothetical protein HID58_067487, partial [Brassica napus]
RKRHYIHSFRIFQPQPSRGKKRRILTRSKPHTARNTSSREANTTLNRSNKIQHMNYQLVPTGSCWLWVLSSDQTFCSPWLLLVSGPILRSDFLQSLVPAGSGSYPQIRLPAVLGHCWFRVLPSDQTFCSPWFLLVRGPILRSDPRSLRICQFRVPTQSRCVQLLTPTGSGSSLQNNSQQPSDPMGAAIIKQALDDIHTSRLTTPPHMGKMQGSQAGHNIFRPDRRSQKKSSWKYHRRTRQPLRGLLPPTNSRRNLGSVPLQVSKAAPLDKFEGVKNTAVYKEDKSTGPPREVASTPKQRSPFLQGPVTGLRTLYPADECQSSLKHQQVHLCRTLHHWEKPTRKRHYIHSFRIFQPQPSRGKKRRTLTRSKPHTAGNTSSREVNTALNRSNKIQHRNYQLVPTGFGSYPQIRLSAVHGYCWFRDLSSDKTFCSPWFLLVPGPILRSDFLQSMSLLEPGPTLRSDFLQSLVPAGSGSYPQIRSPQSSDLPVLGPNPKLMSTIIDSCWFWIFTTQQVSTFGPNGGSHHQASPRRHPYFQTQNSASYGKDARFSSGTQHFPPGFTTWTNSKDRRSQKKSSWKYHRRTRQPLRVPTTLLPLFPATNPDIPLKEIKAFYPLQTPGETQDPCLSKSSCARALVPRSLQVLKDKSTGPPREVASTTQQRSPFLQGPVTGLRTLYPADESSPSLSNPTSLRETYVSYKTGKKILSSTEIQDQGPESYKITFEQVQNLEILIKTPVYHLEKRLSSRF